MAVAGSITSKALRIVIESGPAKLRRWHRIFLRKAGEDNERYYTLPLSAFTKVSTPSLLVHCQSGSGCVSIEGQRCQDMEDCKAMYEGNTLSLFSTPSCVTSHLGGHKFHITYVEEISTAFRCCEVCGKTSRLRCTVSDTWEDINEPASAHLGEVKEIVEEETKRVIENYDFTEAVRRELVQIIPERKI